MKKLSLLPSILVLFCIVTGRAQELGHLPVEVPALINELPQTKNSLGGVRYSLEISEACPLGRSLISYLCKAALITTGVTSASYLVEKYGDDLMTADSRSNLRGGIPLLGLSVGYKIFEKDLYNI